jgi:hypothetical protein
LAEPQRAPSSLRKTRLCFECFPYVCPEPVCLVKTNVSVQNGIAKDAFSVRTADVIEQPRFELLLAAHDESVLRDSAPLVKHFPMFSLWLSYGKRNSILSQKWLSHKDFLTCISVQTWRFVAVSPIPIRRCITSPIRRAFSGSSIRKRKTPLFSQLSPTSVPSLSW